jgi:hypothetical protein
MNLDLVTIVLIAAAVLLGIAYFMRRSSRIKKGHRKL